jgi:hypothetical protein
MTKMIEQAGRDRLPGDDGNDPYSQVLPLSNFRAVEARNKPFVSASSRLP